MKLATIKTIAAIAPIGFLSTANASGVSGLNLSAKLPDYVPVNMGPKLQCQLTAEFKNAGPGSQLKPVITMDHRFVLQGDFYINNVHYKNKTWNYGDLKLNVMHPGATKAFVSPWVRIAGPTRVTWTVNSHGGGGIPEKTKANNTMTKTLNCAGNLKKQKRQGQS